MKKTASGPARVTLALRVNGETREVSFLPHRTLLEVLREDMGLTGTKHGCELGECGTCTVLADGEPVLSCLALALEFEGQRRSRRSRGSRTPRAPTRCSGGSRS